MSRATWRRRVSGPVANAGRHGDKGRLARPPFAPLSAANRLRRAFSRRRSFRSRKRLQSTARRSAARTRGCSDASSSRLAPWPRSPPTGDGPFAHSRSSTPTRPRGSKHRIAASRRLPLNETGAFGLKRSRFRLPPAFSQDRSPDEPLQCLRELLETRGAIAISRSSSNSHAARLERRLSARDDRRHGRRLRRKDTVRRTDGGGVSERG